MKKTNKVFIIYLIFIISAIIIVSGFTFYRVFEKEKNVVKERNCVNKICNDKCKSFTGKYSRILNIESYTTDKFIDCKCMVDIIPEVDTRDLNIPILLENIKCGS